MDEIDEGSSLLPDTNTCMPHINLRVGRTPIIDMTRTIPSLHVVLLTFSGVA